MSDSAAEKVGKIKGLLADLEREIAEARKILRGDLHD